MQMKWVNKGHELDEYAENVCAAFQLYKKVVLFGAGNIGARLSRTLVEYDIFAGFIDNDIEKQQNGVSGEKVYPPSALKDIKALVVISVGAEYCNEIKIQLEDMGLHEYKDYIMAEEFETKWFPVLSYYYFGKLYTNLAQICVTERCTLRCKKCAHACHLVDIQSEDMSLDEAKQSADSFFKIFDKVGEFVLIGGEPFLYKYLEPLIVYIGENYRDQIILFSITTNGTIIPADTLLEVCKKYNVIIRVSDYSNTIPHLKNHYIRFYEKLKDLNSIVWETNNENSWADYGFDNHVLKNEADTLRTFDTCKTLCREVKGKKYYYCVMAHTVANNMNLEMGENDYFDLGLEFDKKELLEFEVGYSEKGFLDMCGICRGKEAGKFSIPAAEQMAL